MKHIKRILPMLALLLVAAMALASCIGFDSDVMTKIQTPNSLNAQVANLDGYEVENEDYDKYIALGLVLLTKTETVNDETTGTPKDVVTKTIYNVSTGSIVMSTTDDKETYEIVGFLIEKKKDTTDETTGVTTSIYSYCTPTGNVVASGLKNTGKVINDCLFVNETVYRLDTETYETIATYTRSELAGDLPACDHWSEDNYYVIGSDTVTVYDNEYGFNGAWRLPSAAEDAEFYYFSDGYVVCQYWVEVDALSDDYDILENGDKYNIITVRIDPDDATADEISTDYIILSVYEDVDSLWNSFSMAGIENIYGDSLESLALVSEIVEKTYSADPRDVIILSTDSGLGGDRVFEVNGENALISPVGNEYAIAMSIARRCFWLIDDSGNIIADMNGAKAYTSQYILSENAIYDYELNKVKDLKTDSGEYVPAEGIGMIGDTLVFEKTTKNETTSLEEVEIYFFKSGTFKLIGKDSEITLLSNMYIKHNTEDNTYTYYDANSKALFTTMDTVEYVVESENALLVVGSFQREGESGLEKETRYWRITW